MNTKTDTEMPVVTIQRLRDMCLSAPYEINSLVAELLVNDYGVFFSGPLPRILWKLPIEKQDHCLTCQKDLDQHGCTYGRLVPVCQFHGNSFMGVEMYCRGLQLKVRDGGVVHHG